jgi:predicted DNA binding CopG/RHH family protein
MMAKRKQPQQPPDMKVVAERVEEDADVSELVSRLEAEADRELAPGSITLRWGRGQIAVVKRAAAILGVPYQTYLKQVVYRQALADIEQARKALAIEPRSGASVRRSGSRAS